MFLKVGYEKQMTQGQCVNSHEGRLHIVYLLGNALIN